MDTIDVRSRIDELRSKVKSFFDGEIPEEMLAPPETWTYATRHLIWLYELDLNCPLADVDLSKFYLDIFVRSEWLMSPYASIIHKMLIARRSKCQ